MNEEDPPSPEDNPPRYGAPTSSKEIGTVSTNGLNPLFEWQSAMVDQAMRNTMIMAGFNAGVIKTFLSMNPWFRAWQKQVDTMFKAWDMPSPSGIYYDYSKEMLEQQIQFLPPVLREWAKYQLMFNPQMQELMHGQGVAGVLEFVGAVLPGEGELYNKKYNHQFLTEYSDGHIGAVDVRKIDQLFPRTKGNGTEQQAFPHIILTSSHAKGERMVDMTSITQGIQALARDSHGKELNITHVNGEISKDPDSTLVLFACDTEKSPFLNAATLLRRLNDLRRIEETGEVDKFENVSPGAKRIAKLVLRCMAQNPDDVDINDPRSLGEIGKSVQLRARPELIAQHFQLIGYSKGGNVVSDAMRYLVSELTAESKGKPLIKMNGEGPTQDNVRGLVRNIACMSIAALEVPMAEHYKHHGVRRISFNNEFDMISNHMHFESTWADHKWTIKGVQQRQGHDPIDALGSKDGRKGYVLDDRRVARRVKEAFAPLYGKAAISSISFTDDDFTRDGSRIKDSILIGTAAGTSDQLFSKHITHIEEMLAQSGFEGKIEATEKSNRRAFVLKGPEGWREDPRALQALYDGFQKLRKENGSGLIVSDDIFERIIPARIEHMQTNRNSHAWHSFQLRTEPSRDVAA